MVKLQFDANEQFKITLPKSIVMAKKWKKGDTITLDLDMSPHFWTGEGACEGLTSVYRGPLLLAFDHRYNLALSPEGEKRIRDYDEWKSETGHRHALKVPGLDAKHMGEQLVEWHDWIPPVLLLKFGAGEGQNVFLCDFGSAGEVGTPYVSWLPVRNVPQETPFSPENPLRSVHV